MGMILVLVAVLVGSAATVVGLLAWARRSVARSRDLWETVARAVEGRLNLRSGFLEGMSSGTLLRVELGGVKLAAGITAGDAQVTFVEAPSRQAGGWVGVSPAGLVARLQVAAGATDITLGDPEFDEAWVVKAHDEAFARSCLDAEARRWIGRSRRYTFAVQADKVTARCGGAERDPAALEAAIRAVAFLATRTSSIRPAPPAGPTKARAGSLFERDPFLGLVGGGLLLLAAFFLPQLIRASGFHGPASGLAVAFPFLLVLFGAGALTPAAHALLKFSWPSAAPGIEALVAAATGVASVIALVAGYGFTPQVVALVLLAFGFGLWAFKSDEVWVRSVASVGMAGAGLTLLVISSHQ